MTVVLASKLPENAAKVDQPFHIPILHIIKLAQQQHGLRHGDYQRYYQYITRKLRRMRKSLHFQQGNRSKVTPKKITPEIATDSRFVMLKVFEIERSWAYAMQLGTEANSEPRKKFHSASRLQKASGRADELLELTSKLNCDAQTKLELQGYVLWIHGIRYFEKKDWIHAKKRLEAAQAIYEGLLKTIDKDVRIVYESRVAELLPRLRYCAHNIGDTSAASDLLRMREEGDVEKGTRGGKSGLSGAGVLEQSELDQLLSQVMASQAQSVTEVEWLGQTIPVKIEAARLAILSVQEADVELKKVDSASAKLGIYESVLKQCVEAIAAVRDELQSLTAAEAAATAAATTGVLDGKHQQQQTRNQQNKQTDISKLPRIRLLHTYLQYLKLSKTVSRNLLHVQVALGAVSTDTSLSPSSKLTSSEKPVLTPQIDCVDKSDVLVASSSHSKPQELARLYDTLVQTLQEVATLPGVMENCDDVTELLQANVLAYKSFRCYYLALAYLQGKKFAESMALLLRAQSEARSAEEALAASPVGRADTVVPGSSRAELLRRLAGLVRQVDAEQLTCRAGRMLEIAGAGAGQSDGLAASQATALTKPLMDQLAHYLDERTLEKKLACTTSPPFVAFPPAFRPVPVKPIFFDLALNHITFPSLVDKQSGGAAAKAAAGATAGLTGMMRGWLWGGNSAADKSSK